MEGPIYPKTYSNAEIAQSGKYKCPLCHTQSTSDQEDMGWVYCPMINNRPIGRACCIDFQGVAISDNFETHSYRSLFQEAANITGLSAEELRLICLEHQVSVANDKISSVSSEISDPELVHHLLDNYERLIAAIEHIKRSAKD